MVSLFKKKNISQSTYSFNVGRHKDIQLCLLFIYLLQNLGREKQPPLKPLDKVYPSAMAEKKMGVMLLKINIMILNQAVENGWMNIFETTICTNQQLFVTGRW